MTEYSLYNNGLKDGYTKYYKNICPVNNIYFKHKVDLYKYDKLNGESIVYYNNGNIKIVKDFVDNQITRYIAYYNTGEKREIGFINNIFSELRYKIYYKNGDIYMKGIIDTNKLSSESEYEIENEKFILSYFF